MHGFAYYQNQFSVDYEAISLRMVGWVLGSHERSPSSLDVVIADVK